MHSWVNAEDICFNEKLLLIVLPVLSHLRLLFFLDVLKCIGKLVLQEEKHRDKCRMPVLEMAWSNSAKGERALIIILGLFCNS